jgi:hypothetical protein
VSYGDSEFKQNIDNSNNIIRDQHKNSKSIILPDLVVGKKKISLAGKIINLNQNPSEFKKNIV